MHGKGGNPQTYLDLAMPNSVGTSSQIWKCHGLDGVIMTLRRMVESEVEAALNSLRSKGAKRYLLKVKAKAARSHWYFGTKHD